MMMQREIQDGPRSSARPLTILVVDPAAEVRSVLQSWFEQLGHNPLCVDSGNEAIRLVKQRSIDLVITEVIMPNGDGLELILEVKKRHPAARMIAVSGGGRYLPAADCLKVARGLGAHAALAKPIKRQDLMQAMETVLARASA